MALNWVGPSFGRYFTTCIQKMVSKNEWLIAGKAIKNQYNWSLILQVKCHHLHLPINPNRFD
jgi:hypothetical protein